ncbi:CocE/NonD family hydrolase [Xanthobacter sp. AM11]|uniref:CocE/NonD family hydrolase n=1 Tax=Xanthobacter sp. AM11 TaxID=3380643 RepID=UPI0039BF84EE
MKSLEPTTELRYFKGDAFEVHLKALHAPAQSHGAFPQVEPGSAVHGGIRVDRDVAVAMRDGATIYVDIYRPDGVQDIPAIVAWSPYGKRIGYAAPLTVPGVPAGTLSSGTKLEGPDPDYWCRRGYAVVNPDARGAGYSQGVLQILSNQEGRDAADLVEWLAAQSWCNGRIGMAGNSWLAMSQWMTAAERPKHLACIAPWEGATDLYRQLFYQGGIQEIGFSRFLASFLVGAGMGEDIAANFDAHPFYDAYWREKVADLKQIEVPAYITAGWSHFHLLGSIDAFRRIGSDAKWLRIHREFEWPDFYAPENLNDLCRFFDRYLKGHHNGWELTPRVRIDVMDRGDRDHALRRAELDFPLPDTRYRKLFLDASNATLTEVAPTSPTKMMYDAVAGQANFDFVFDCDTELTGYFKIRLWVEALEADDLDLFVAVQKADAAGNVVPTFVIGQPHPGAPGLLRASHRKLDEQRSTDIEPVHLHVEQQMLLPGEIVPVEIAIWPTSRLWRAGERLRIAISGHYLREPGWFEPFAWDLRNTGNHVIHTGGEYDSYLLIPEIKHPRSVVPGRSITSDTLHALHPHD